MNTLVGLGRREQELLLRETYLSRLRQITVLCRRNKLCCFIVRNQPDTQMTKEVNEQETQRPRLLWDDIPILAVR